MGFTPEVRSKFTDVSGTALEVRRQAADKEIWASRVDADRTLEWRWPVHLKAGLRYRGESQVQDQDRFTAAVASAVGRNLSGYLDESWRNGGAVDRYPVGALPGFDKLLGNNVRFVGNPDPRAAWAYDPSMITVNANTTVQQSLLNDGKINEDVYAAYLQGSVGVGRLTLLGGGRFERTELAANTTVRNRAFSDPLAQFGGRVRSSVDYENFFPTLHARYGVSDTVVVRAAITTTIGRPDIGTVLANSDINASNRSVTTGNPALKPQYSTNYDLSVEFYFKPVGVLSAGVFQKNIRDYISSPTVSISAAQAAEYGAPLTNPSPTDMSWTLTRSENIGAVPAFGFYLRHVRDIAFFDCRFGFEENDDRPPVTVDRGEKVRFEGCTLQPGTGIDRVVVVRNGPDVTIVP
jgi:TonB-dependent receptor